MGEPPQVFKALASGFVLTADLAQIRLDRKSTRLNSSHTVIYTLSLHDALPISEQPQPLIPDHGRTPAGLQGACERFRTDRGPGSDSPRSEEHTSELQSHSDLHSFPTRRSSDL